MKKWSNKCPENDGPYWLLEKRFEDGKLTDIYGPNIVEVNVEDGNYVETMMIGDDCPHDIPKKMVNEQRQPRDPVFAFDDQETAEEKLKDTVIRRREYYVQPIEKPSVPKTNFPDIF